jgi:hypothetical protein
VESEYPSQRGKDDGQANGDGGDHQQSASMSQCNDNEKRAHQSGGDIGDVGYIEALQTFEHAAGNP